MTSRTMRAGRNLASASSARSPRLQTATSNPSLFKISSSPSRMCGSSSTTRMRVLLVVSRAFIKAGPFGGRELRRQRQSQGETTATSIAWRIADGAAVGFGNAAGQGQSKAGPLDTTGQRVVSPEKLLENLFLATRWKTPSPIQHGPLGVTIAGGREGHFDLFPIGGIFLGVGEQVQHYLRDGVPITADADRSGGKIRSDSKSAGLQLGAVMLERIPGESRQIQDFKLGPLLSPLQ